MKSKIYFVWEGISDPKIREHWKDGLYQAMKYLEEDYDVIYCEPFDEIKNDGIILYWEAPCTIKGGSKTNYEKIHNAPNKKILLFAGGPLKKEWVENFDMILIESKENEKDCKQQGIKYDFAFGINDKIFYPENLEKIYDGIHHATCATWKRQGLLCEALKDKACVVGRDQQTDGEQFRICRLQGSTVLNQQEYPEVRKLLNQSKALVQTSDYWGGGQRATLEAMACGIPVICMLDSMKNREYIQESGFGEMIDPNVEEIKKALERVKKLDPQIGINYIKNKWTAHHYYQSLKKAICDIQS